MSSKNYEESGYILDLDLLAILYHTVMAFSVTCVISVTCPILRCVLGYTNGQQLHHKCHLMTLGVQVHLLIYWHEYVQ